MRFPKPLPANGTIGFVAPSFGCASGRYRVAFDKALCSFEEKGYKTLLGPNCYKEDGIGISTNSADCATELMDMYCDSQSDVLISCGGGELMCETISQVDFDKIKNANPKWYMGYSDNTNFVFLQTTLCDTAAIYGPCASSFGTDDEHQMLRDAMKLLTSDEESISFAGYGRFELNGLRDDEHPTAGLNLDTKSQVKAYIADGKPWSIDTPDNQKVEMKGRLVGGCLDILTGICGTRFDRVKEFVDKYKDDGIIWFFEACDLNMMSIRRAIWELKEAGWFAYTKGFVVGRPRIYDEEMMGLNRFNAVYDLLSEYKVPIIMDVDLGHLPPMVPVICGSLVTVSAADNGWKITMEKK